MAFIQAQVFSSVLGKMTGLNVILPQTALGQIGVDAKEVQATYPVLYLLHGMSDDQSAWMRFTCIERYAMEHGIAVVMPDGGLSFYTDMVHGGRYLTYIAEELPSICHDLFPRISTRREDTFAAGNSMGGYGAVKLALTHPETFSHAATLSGVMNIQRFCDILDENGKKTLSHDFADITRVAGTPDDLHALIPALARSGKPLPRIFMWCGTEDFLYPDHEPTVAAFTGNGYDLTHSSSAGNHGWAWWDEQIRRVLDWLPI